jgi:hypothetical protein
LLAAFFVAACGSRTPLDTVSSSETGATPTRTPTNCVYGKLGNVRGLPLGLASTGDTVFVVSADVGGVIGDLNAIASDGVVHLVVKGNAYIGMTTFGSTIAFNRRSFDDVQNFLGATVEIVNSDFSTTQIDATSANVAQLDSLTTDGTSIYWYRWPPSSDPLDPTNYGIPAIAKYDGGSFTTLSIDPTSSTPQGLVTDGTNFFSVFLDAANGGGYVVGTLPVDGEPARALAESPIAAPEYSTVVGVDDANVIAIRGNDAWAIPKSGGTAIGLVSNQTTEDSPNLYQHHFIWAQENADGSGSISSVSTSGGTIATIATTASSIPIVTTDACGVVYATTDSSAPGTTAASIYRVEL